MAKARTKAELEARWVAFCALIDLGVADAEQAYREISDETSRVKGYHYGFASAMRYVRDRARDFS